MLAGSLAIAAIVYAPFGFSNLPAHLSTEVTWSVIGLAAVPTFAGFIVFFALIGEIGPVRTTIVTYVNPAVALILGVCLLGEPFTVGLGLGFPLVIAGSVLATRRRPTRCHQITCRGRSLGAGPYDVTQAGRCWTVLRSG